MSLPVVAVVGRPNVGKSTLVNRILGRREAIVEERPGVTRDRVLYTAEWQGKRFLLVDTGGLDEASADPLAAKVTETALDAARAADAIMLVLDVTSGITPEDRDVVDSLRRLGRPIVLVANKADNTGRGSDVVDLYELGIGEPHPVSALHGRGIGDLLDEITSTFEQFEDPEDGEPGIAIVGRPNVGKSSLFNRLVGAERSIVHDEAGTTRDSVDTVVTVGEDRFRFVDTAGLRRASKVDEPTEYYGTVRTMQALDRSEIAILVVDESEGISRQDLRIAERIVELGRSAIIVLNKIDLVEPRERRIEGEEVRRRLPYLDFAPLLQISAKTGSGVEQILPTIRRILEGRGVRVPTHLLNAVLDDLQARTPIPSSGKHLRVKYAVQAESSPPVVVLFGPSRLPQRWLRYIERGLRKRFGFEGTPIRFVSRGGETHGRGGRNRPAGRKR